MKGMLVAAAFENVKAPLNQGKRDGSNRALAVCPGDEVSGSAGVQRKQVGSEDEKDGIHLVSGVGSWATPRQRLLFSHYSPRLVCLSCT